MGKLYHNNSFVLAFLLVIEVLLLFDLGLTISCIEEEREALLKLKASFLDPSDRLISWKGTNCCIWQGVSCSNSSGNVLKLDLQNDEVNFSTALRANLIDPSLLGLKHLNYLDLSGNYFNYSKIPDFLDSLHDLRHLDLSRSYFNGSIPSRLGNLTNLLVLNLSRGNNQDNRAMLFVDDFVWISHLSSLQYLDLSRVNFENASSNLMQVLNALPSLLSLKLSGCDLDHTHLSDAPSNSSFLPKLQLLDLSYNMFNCPIPDSFQNMSSLVSLDLSSSEFNSVIPLWLSKLRNLVVLRLRSNFFSRIEGGLSTIVENNRRLNVFDLSFNYNLRGNVFGIRENSSASDAEYDLQVLRIRFAKVEATIPDWLGQFKNLKSLDLYESELYGPIPSSLGNLSSIENFEAGGNMLSGGIPASFGKLLNLIELKLGQNNLNGTVPHTLGNLQNLKMLDISGNALKNGVSEIHFANLSQLDTLWLYDNNLLSLDMKSNWVPPFQLRLFSAKSCKGFNTEFPQWLQTQRELVFLDLSSTNIFGAIPAWLGGPNLMALDLSYNHINGSLPERIGEQIPRIGSLYVAGNHISGTLPQSICKFIRPTALDLSGNELSGTIPSCLLTQQLKLLDLSSNKFSSAFPDSDGIVSPLDQLHLDHNNLGGELPIVLEKLKSLTLLDVAGNQFSGNIPTWVGESLGNLRILNLRSNMFNGTIPSTICRLPHLQNLDLAYNRLTGNIPRNLSNLTAISVDKLDRSKGMIMYCFMFSPYCNYQRNVIQYFKSREDNYSNIFQMPLMVNMDLSKNFLFGLIPSEITALEGLVGLNLSHNNLSGSIPFKMGRMTSLQSLDLSFNELSGRIPVSMSNLNSLGVLKLSDNNFSGLIPREGHLLTFNDVSTFEGNPYLCGEPLPIKCPNEKSFEQPSGIDNGQGWDKREKMWFCIITMLGYVFGLWGFVGVLIFKRSWRYAYFQFVDETKDKIHAAIFVKIARLKLRIKQL